MEERLRGLLRLFGFSLAILAASVSGLAHAGVGVWTSGGPYGGSVSVLAIDPLTPSTLYAGTNGQLFKSTDAGTTWAPASFGLPNNTYRLAIDPSTPSTVYASTAGGVFKSIDSGDTWNSMGAGLLERGAFALAIDPSTPSTIYVAAVSGLFKSADSGGTWARAGTSFPGYTSVLAIDPSTPSTIYTGSESGVYKSTDSGGTWAPAGAGSPTYARVLVIDSTAPSTLYVASGATGLYKSIDAGRTWAWIGAGAPFNDRVSDLVIDPSTPWTLYAGTSDAGIFRSIDSGMTWVPLNNGLADLHIWALVIDPSAPATLYVGTPVGLFRSIDSGGTWNPANNGITSLPIGAIASSPSVPSTLYAATFYRSTNSGGTWALAPGTDLKGVPVFALVVDPAIPSTVYAGTIGSVYKSIDAGDSWVSVGNGITIWDQVRTLAIDPSTPSTIYAGMYGWAKGAPAVFKSTDSGGSWVAASSGISNAFAESTVLCLAIDPSTPSTLYAGTEKGLFKSTDSGFSWNATNSGLGIPNTKPILSINSLAIDPSTPSTLYAGTNEEGVFKSTDSGNSWAPANTGLTSPGVSALAVDPAVPSTVYAATGRGVYAAPARGGVFRSTDSGGTWAPFDAGLPAEAEVNLLSIGSTGGSTTLFAGLEEGSVWQMTPSGNGTTFPVTIPIVLSVAGLRGAYFTSELTFSNRGASAVPMRFTYTPAFGDLTGISSTAWDTLAAGTQKILRNATEYLRALNLEGGSGNRGGTLRIDFSGPAAATVRTTTAVPGGRAGLAYPGLPPSRLLSAPVFICGLRQNVYDRSNVAVLNAGTASEGPITLRLTVVSGDPAQPLTQVVSDITLSPGGFWQVNGILTRNGLSLTNGYVKVDRIAGTAPFYAYGVINDQVTSDGSYVQPVPAGPPSAVTGLTLPVLVETSAFSSELVVANFSSSPRTLYGTWVASALTWGLATFEISLLPNEQQILPAFVQVLRDRGNVTDPPGPVFAGAVFFTDHTGDLRGISIAARTSTPAGGGRYGVFYSAVPAGAEATTTAWLYGLQQNAENRTNLALVNIGSVDSLSDTFRIQLFDGTTGKVAGTAEDVSVPANGFVQINGILSRYAPGVSNGYALVTKTSGNNPFIAYAVINDGGRPGERSGDGAFIEAQEP